MKRQLLLLALTGFFFIPVFGQVLYTSTAQAGVRTNLGIGKAGTPIVLIDDVLIPSSLVQGSDSISITQLRFGILRSASAPAVTVRFYYTAVEDTTQYFIDDVIKIPPLLLGSIALPANGATPSGVLVLLGDSINTLFKIKTDTGNLFTNFHTFFLGVSFSDTSRLNGWALTVPGTPQSRNVDALWIYDADDPPQFRFWSDFQDQPGTPSATFYMQVFGKGLSPLPVTFSQFTARRTGSINVLNWSTQQEINTSHFIIERSTDGGGYTNIGRVAAAGNSSTVRNYTFTDPRPVKGNNYYRVRTVDLDNSIKLSDIRRIRNEGIADISIYPNPVANLLSVAISADKATEGQLTVTDISGKALYSRIVKLPAGNTLLPVPLSNMAAGTYIIKVQLNDDVVIKKFVKQ